MLVICIVKDIDANECGTKTHFEKGNCWKKLEMFHKNTKKNISIKSFVGGIWKEAVTDANGVKWTAPQARPEILILIMKLAKLFPLLF